MSDEIIIRAERSEAQHLLSNNDDWTEMDSIPKEEAPDKNATRVEASYADNEERADSSRQISSVNNPTTLEHAPPIEYKVYKIRWFGLGQLILLNIIVSWDVSISSILHLLRSEMISLTNRTRSGSPSPPSPTLPQHSIPRRPA